MEGQDLSLPLCALVDFAIEDVDGEGEHYFCAADEAADAYGFVGAVGAAEHWVVVGVGAVEAVGYRAERSGEA